MVQPSNTSVVLASSSTTCQPEPSNLYTGTSANDNTMTIVFGILAIVLAAFALVVAMLQLMRTPKPESTADEEAGTSAD